MSFFNLIINALGRVSGFFYDLYRETYGWVWPFYYVANIFYWLSSVFADLSWYFYYFSDWAYDVWNAVTQILSWDTIWNFIKQYAGALLDIFYGLWNWWNYVRSVVNDWWLAMQYTVQGWIATAVGGLQDIAATFSNFWNYLWPTLTRGFDNLKSAWDNFWSYTVPNLVDFSWLTTWWKDEAKDIDTWIDSKIRNYFPWYDDLVNLMADIKLFFTSPLTWLIKKLEDWFWTEEES